jgi:hypothetical protein
MRRRIVQAVTCGDPLGISLVADKKLLKMLVDEPAADQLDAVLCALQASWGWIRRHQTFGLPLKLDPLEGWIVTVPLPR